MQSVEFVICLSISYFKGRNRKDIFQKQQYYLEQKRKKTGNHINTTKF